MILTSLSATYIQWGVAGGLRRLLQVPAEGRKRPVIRQTSADRY